MAELPDGQPMPEGFDGSNVDLGTYHEIDAELVARAHALDGAMQRWRKVSDEWREATDRYHAARFEAIERIQPHVKTMTAAKLQAEHELREQKLQRNMLAGAREFALELVTTERCNLSAAQTRASIWRTQVDLDRGGPS